MRVREDDGFAMGGGAPTTMTDDEGVPRRRSPSVALAVAAMRRPRHVVTLVLLAALAASLGFLRLAVDTDPENMLPADDPVRVRNAELAEAFGGGPMVVVGLLGDTRGAAAIAAIDRVHDGLATRPDVDEAATISVASTFEEPPTDDGGAAWLLAAVEQHPLLGDNVVFDRTDEGGPAGAALFVALRDKAAATDVADAARSLVAIEPALGSLEVAVAGQPLAEDAFGQEMFVQMAIFAPLAGLFVFAILLLFFRRLQLVLPAMLLAMATVVITMGALVGSGNTLHIMSSMIPIFLMPIAILDAVHVVSEFFDQRGRGDRHAVLEHVVAELGRPIGFTTLTTAVGFAALALVPIPPVRVFGLFVALGVAIAWLLTLTLLPAYLVLVDEARLATTAGADGHGRRLAAFGAWVTRRPRRVLVAVVVLGAVAVPGVASLAVNDNPVRWFRADHEVRVAGEQLAEALPGTFTANLLLTERVPGALDTTATRADVAALADGLRAHPVVGAVQTYVDAPLPMLRAGDQANVRLQLVSGDNVDMAAVVERVDALLAQRPVDGVSVALAGEAFLNLTWQQEMVRGMLGGFATTLVVILVLLVALFRSVRWAVLAMLPVLWTVLVVYGAMGLVGRDVDMPVAVLSTMVLGIGVDFAIHFVERFRALRAVTGSTAAASTAFFAEPARALTRNAIVIAVGFSPLLLSSLVPYVVVGVLLASIVGLSWLATIVVLPAAVQLTDRRPTAPAPPQSPSSAAAADRVLVPEPVA